MPPTLILIRHAQAEHNVSNNIPDPQLTPLGLEQAAALSAHLQKRLPGSLDPELIVVSPFRRCLQTATIAFDWLIDAETGKSKVPMVANASWQENADKPCDTGTDPTLVAPKFPHIDFSALDPVYPDKTSPAASLYHYTRAALLARAQSCLRELRSRPERVIAVVSHSAFMRQAVTGCWYMNADYRIFDFADVADGDELRLVQWDETKAGGMGLSLEVGVELGEGLPETLSDAVPAEDKKLPE
ncbi:uncharacterized protein PgNI_02876 [Pyricularia grisea]|uniref:Phosphoglycerate mutase-like protein n=1 Tax=Pyricularia grisea TaxID=148305 RepID=A0A6P8BEB3_PYRGI|nr:uncharacterized protein PgNI_02876 [Pyricularia grisea]TLD14168.1 hypothetical protein PgNI_02876 [Pyricularia grisea]